LRPSPTTNSRQEDPTARRIGVLVVVSWFVVGNKRKRVNYEGAVQSGVE